MCSLAGVELYDLSNDPDENVNVANATENAETVAALRAALRAQFASTLPCPPPQPAPPTPPGPPANSCNAEITVDCGSVQNDWQKCQFA